MKIKELRGLKGLTIVELATKIGVSKSALGKYERGQAEPSIKNLIKLADVFGVSVDTLIEHDAELLDLGLLDSNRKLVLDSIVYKLDDQQVSKVLKYIIEILAK